MRYKQLGKTGLKVSTLTVGTWAMGGIGWGSFEEKNSIDSIHAMLDNGVNHIDAAWVYGLGASDKIIGKALKGIDRDKFIITEKAGFRNNPNGGPNYPDCSTEFMTYCFEDSLKNLGLDYVDLFLIHGPDTNTPFEETAELLNKWKKEGKVGHLGVSNYSIEQIEEISKYMDVEAVQLGYSMVNRGMEDILKWAHEHHIGCMTHSSLGSGILTGTFRELPKFADDDVRVLYPNPNFQEPRFSKVMELSLIHI